MKFYSKVPTSKKFYSKVYILKRMERVKVYPMNIINVYIIIMSAG